MTRHVLRKLGIIWFEMVTILVVLGAVGLLVIMLDPFQFWAKRRDQQRLQDMTFIAEAFYRYRSDHQGALPSGFLPNQPALQIGTCTDQGQQLCPTAKATCVDVSTAVNVSEFEIPFDPKVGTREMSGYMITFEPNHVVTVQACQPETESLLRVSR